MGCLPGRGRSGLPIFCRCESIAAMGSRRIENGEMQAEVIAIEWVGFPRLSPGQCFDHNINNLKHTDFCIFLYDLVIFSRARNASKKLAVRLEITIVVDN